MKFIFLFLLSLTLVCANEAQKDSDIVKTSELELFLFKMGFQSLLNDVDITKNKASLNEEELKKLNSKIEIIMDELYKNKRVLKTDSNSVVLNDTSYKKDIEELREEVSFLKKQINKLQPTNFPKANKKEVVQKQISKDTVTVRVDEVNVRAYASNNAPIIEVLNKGNIINIERCNKFGWCKLKGEKKYVAKFLLNL